MQDFSGKHAIITGASSGIGAEFARQLHGRGARVTLVARRKPALEQLAHELNRLRALARETELAAIAAWRQKDCIRHEDALLALNRLSSYFYVLQLRAAQQK